MGPVPERDTNGARATIREVMALVDASRKEILAEIGHLEAKVDAKFEGHTTKHEADAKLHAEEHKADRKERRGLIRWAVTTILTGLGTLFAIVWSVTHG